MTKTKTLAQKYKDSITYADFKRVMPLSVCYKLDLGRMIMGVKIVVMTFNTFITALLICLKNIVSFVTFPFAKRRYYKEFKSCDVMDKLFRELCKNKK